MPVIHANDYPYKNLADKFKKTSSEDRDAYRLIRLADDWKVQCKYTKSASLFFTYLRQLTDGHSHLSIGKRNRQIWLELKKLDQLRIINIDRKPHLHIRLGKSDIGFIIQRISKYNRKQTVQIKYSVALAVIAALVAGVSALESNLLVSAVLIVVTIAALVNGELDLKQIGISKKACVALLHFKLNDHSYLRSIQVYHNSKPNQERRYRDKKHFAKKPKQRPAKRAKSKNNKNRLNEHSSQDTNTAANSRQEMAHRKSVAKAKHKSPFKPLNSISEVKNEKHKSKKN